MTAFRQTFAAEENFNQRNYFGLRSINITLTFTLTTSTEQNKFAFQRVRVGDCFPSDGGPLLAASLRYFRAKYPGHAPDLSKPLAS